MEYKCHSLPDNVKWIKNNSTISQDDSKYNITNVGIMYRLNILNATFDDYGYYTFFASYGVSNYSDTVPLNVKGWLYMLFNYMHMLTSIHNIIS